MTEYIPKNSIMFSEGFKMEDKKIKVDPKKVKKEELQGIFSKVLDKLKSG